MTLLSKIADGYESGEYVWVQNDYGDTKQDMVDNPERTPRFCPIGALWELGNFTPASEVAERALHDAARGCGYPTYTLYNDAPDRTLDEVLEFMRAAELSIAEGLDIR